MQRPKIESVTAVEKYALYTRFLDSREGEYAVSRLAGKGVFTSWEADNNFFIASIRPNSGP